MAPHDREVIQIFSVFVLLLPLVIFNVLVDTGFLVCILGWETWQREPEGRWFCFFKELALRVSVKMPLRTPAFFIRMPVFKVWTHFQLKLSDGVYIVKSGWFDSCPCYHFQSSDWVPYSWFGINLDLISVGIWEWTGEEHIWLSASAFQVNKNK